MPVTGKQAIKSILGNEDESSHFDGRDFSALSRLVGTVSADSKHFSRFSNGNGTAFLRSFGHSKSPLVNTKRIEPLMVPVKNPLRSHKKWSNGATSDNMG